VEIREILLPGVGLRYEFTTAGGEDVGVVVRRSGDFDLVTFDPDDPDTARVVIKLNRDEADTLAEILGAPRIAERFADLTREVPGLVAGQVAIEPRSTYDGQPLGATRARTRTGASVVALVRGDQVIASPTPDQPLSGGDVLVVIGTTDGIAGVERIVRS
jgi:K+:H+ antiporter subunit KhtT